MCLVPLTGQAGLGDWLKSRLEKNEEPASALDAKTMAAGIRKALEQGTDRAVATLGKKDGYFRHPTLAIPVPEKLRKPEKLLRKLGQDKYADQFILSLNRAAESAAPEAKAIFLDVIRHMTVKDAVDIIKGPDDAATRYFRAHSEETLTRKFLPIVTTTTDKVGVTRDYKRFVDKAGTLSKYVDTSGLDIDAYVTQKALDGLFHMIAAEEQRIRRDPVARTTEILRKVFQ